MKKPCKERSLAYLDVELSKEWDYENNYPRTPEDVTRYSHRKVYWVCQEGHSYLSTIANRSNSRGCPYCANLKICDDNCLAKLLPHLEAEWCDGKNKKLNLSPYNVSIGSSKKVWWICRENREHIYEAIIKDRSRGVGCPYCAGKKVSNDNCLSIMNPELASEWNYKKNNDLTPALVTSHSNKKVWWKCKEGHEYSATINNRSNGDGCPYCSGHKVNQDNCLRATNQIGRAHV